MCFATKPGSGRIAAFVTKSHRTCERTHIHRGGGSPLEKLPSRQKVAASEIGKEGGTKSPLATLSPTDNVATSEMAKECVHMAK
jgi:hypothetical protein